MNKMMIQSIWRAALKTFVQAFLVTFAPLALASLNGYVETVQSGGEVVFDFTLWWSFLIGGAAGGGAAMISLAWNWAKNIK